MDVVPVLPWYQQRYARIAGLVLVMIILHLALRIAGVQQQLFDRLAIPDLPLLVALIVGGGPLLAELLGKAARFQFGADMLAGISIATSLVLQEYLAGAIVVLMLSGGETLEQIALSRAGDALSALAQRMPSIARKRTSTGPQVVPLQSVVPNDELVISPHEVCPVDGVVIEGRSHMDESFLSGEPYVIPKLPGSEVLSGAINGESGLIIRCVRPAVDSRYAQVQRVMEEGVRVKPRMRRMADQLGAWFTPLALVIALGAWYYSGDAKRLLAVLVVATPCPLLIAIPVAQMGAISRAAKQQILIRDPAVLERIESCRTAIFDKTGTLTTGRPQVTAVFVQPPWQIADLVSIAGSVEQYSKHPLAAAILAYAKELGTTLQETIEVREPPGAGLTGTVGKYKVQLTGRKVWLQQHPDDASRLPPRELGLECLVAIDGQYAGMIKYVMLHAKKAPP